MNDTKQTFAPERIADNYLAAWNETDASKRSELVANLWTSDGTYLDPLMQGQGVSQIAHLIGAAQQQFAGLQFTRAGQAEQVGDHVRFSWHLSPAGGQPVAGGTDFCQLNETGLLQSVTGFIDFMPTAS
ncbi:nuclear transport factor 2 family protein [bacterium]|nr:MAG: nuclear transport factor 2 family protein [bacterium]